MTNTVIGDNVNSASRLEGLTRIYKVPVICSQFIKEDLEKTNPNHNYFFLELDIVQVKGKTEGKKIFYPIKKEKVDYDMQIKLDTFSKALKLYYDGDWETACIKFKECNLPLADVFIDRTLNYKCPKNWNGIWTMTSK